MTNTQDTWPAGATATMDVTYTQANAAGGAVVCEILPGAGNEYIVLAVRAINSGTNGVLFQTKTAVNGTALLVHQSIASAAGASGGMGVGFVATTNAAASAYGAGYPLVISGTQVLGIQQSAAGAQNDTFRVLINIRCKGALPTVTHASSTNPANVSVTAGAESFTTV